MTTLAWFLQEYLKEAENIPAMRQARPSARAQEVALASRPMISVIVSNYNGAPWLKRCLSSLRAQTIFRELEIIVADNASPDKSADLAATLLRDVPNGRVRRNPTDLGYCDSNNLAVQDARGQYVIFVNNDAWLEPDCLERLLHEVRATGATAAAPLVLDYVNGAVQTAGEAGFDIFGFMSHQPEWSRTQPVLVAAGCGLLIDTNRFRELGGFDSQFKFYAEEYDFCWRIWLAGGKVVLVPSARMHHRGAAGVNPEGFCELTELRTSDTKRYYANRNNLLVLLKNAQHLLLLLAPLQILLLLAETVFMAALTRRWSHVKRAFCEPLRDCWRLRRHVLSERRRIGQLRQHGDLWMLRFLRAPLNRWGELSRFWKYHGLKVDAK
jgi:GT2 family glycosyltransferase